jgi:hypothetical protein
MKPRAKPQDSGTQELFRAKLINIINRRHELVRLGELIDWERLEAHCAPYYREVGRPGLRFGWRPHSRGQPFLCRSYETSAVRSRAPVSASSLHSRFKRFYRRASFPVCFPYVYSHS